MCGIAGIYRLDGSEVSDPGLIRSMRDSLWHRGPDEAGELIDGPVAFGFRRLSVIDIPLGKQPMRDEETGTILVFNGEIYNYKELRKQLEALGHRFRTRSDTEVLLRSLIQWKEGALARLTGMFAFALWDPSTRTIMLARDRLGIKPLYWTRIQDEILFASETKAFFHHRGFQAEADLRGISSYLTFRQAVWDIGFLRGVNKLLPGHFVVIGPGGSITSREYWRLPVPAPDYSRTEHEYEALAEELLTRALRRCLIADIPLGIYLSGGLDSSILVALMSRYHSEQIRSFSIGYGERDYDEGGFAQQIAKHFGARHIHLTMDQGQYESSWPALVKHRDAPLSIPHEIPLYHLSAELKKSVSVAIAGDGADELFGGYGRVFRSPLDWKKVQLLRKVLGPSLCEAIGNSSLWRGTAASGLSRRRHVDQFFDVYHWMSFDEKWSLLSGDAMGEIERDAHAINVFERLFDETAGADPYDRVFHVFQKIHLVCLLERLDAVGMAASVEGRVPFVDHELVECIIHMPRHLKLRWKSKLARLRALGVSGASASERLDTTKPLLRSIGKSMVPPDIAGRKKLGFPTPLDSWFRGGLGSAAKELLLDRRSRERGIFRPDALERFLSNPQDLPYDFYGKKVWMLMNVEMWFRQIIDARRDVSAAAA